MNGRGEFLPSPDPGGRNGFAEAPSGSDARFQKFPQLTESPAAMTHPVFFFGKKLAESFSEGRVEENGIVAEAAVPRRLRGDPAPDLGPDLQDDPALFRKGHGADEPGPTPGEGNVPEKAEGLPVVFLVRRAGP